MHVYCVLIIVGEINGQYALDEHNFRPTVLLSWEKTYFHYTFEDAGETMTYVEHSFIEFVAAETS